MLIKSYIGPFEHVVIENYYDNDELELMWKEMEFLTPKLLDPEYTNAARKEGSLLKNGTGVFLDEVYKDRNISNILSFNRKLWHPTILQELEKISPWWNLIRICNKDYTLLNYYQDGCYYKSHKDHAIINAISIIYKDDNHFDGGDIVFSDYDITLPKKSNTLILFPSQINHAVTDIKMKTNLSFAGRYSMAQFLYVNG